MANPGGVDLGLWVLFLFEKLVLSRTARVEESMLVLSY
jgi:hypothetical protein